MRFQCLPGSRVLRTLLLVCSETLFSTIFALASNSYSVVYNFPAAEENPIAGFVADASGNLYVPTAGGTAGTIVELSPPAEQGGTWSETTIFSFNGTSDGSAPYSGLIIDSKGNLYGTTVQGGNGTCLLAGQNFGCGVVFELSQSGGVWSETVLYNFQGGKDGRNPWYASMTFDSAGNLYGTTLWGGGSGCSEKVGCGVLFKLTPPSQDGGAWTESVLHRFEKKQGVNPQGNLLYLNGALYGLTGSGGANDFGTAYEATLKGEITVINDFTGAAGGSDNFPGGLAADSSGNLYGFTYTGGASDFGVIFELSGSGKSWTETVLYNFTGQSDGGNPVGAPVIDKSGNLYGNAQAGGNSSDCGYTAQQDGCGVVFELATSGSKIDESVLHAFTGGLTQSDDDGAFPEGTLILSLGNLYGTTGAGGTGECNYGCGTAFSLTP
jgi:uncharacterized repeat protein (TIGR03803 family)